MLESRWVAATYGGSHWKNAGETADIGTASGGIAVGPPTVRISPGPGMISTGTMALIWVGLTKDTGAGSPLTVTPTPSSLVGRKPPTMSLATEARVALAR